MSDKACMAHLVMEYQANLAESNILQTRRAEILTELHHLTNGVDAIIGGYKFISSRKKANAPYKQIVTELLPDIDIDLWRGPSMPYYSIRAVKD